jgi:hypothetical protein
MISIELIKQHQILLIRCNPLDREWIVAQLIADLPDCQRWKLHSKLDDSSTPLTQLLTAGWFHTPEEK